MFASLRSTIIVLSVGVVVLVGVWLYWSSWSSHKIFAECRATNPDDPVEYEIYSECMKSEGLNPEDWE